MPLAERLRDYRSLGTDPDLVRLRLQASAREEFVAPAGGVFAVPPDLGAPVSAAGSPDLAGVVVADWADKGAVWASLAVPAGTRLIVRTHGMDAFSLWPHLLDTSRIEAFIAVSPHHGALLEEVLRHGPAGVVARREGRDLPPVITIPHAPSLAPGPRRPGDLAAKVREPHTVGMVGWGKKVKDPLFALEVLGRLRRAQPGTGWRLRLVGAELAPGSLVTTADYAREFAARLEEDDVAGAVDLVGQTDDVAAEVARMGFILSTSVRESFHLGLTEGVLGGAVPVVRDWPAYARQGAAGALFPPGWVVTDVSAAAARVLALTDPAARAAAAQQAQLQLAERFDPERVTRRLREVVYAAEEQPGTRAEE